MKVTVTTGKRRVFGAATAAVALLALSACGDGGSDDGDVVAAGGDANTADTEDAEDNESLDADAQALAFAECMRGEGVDMPDPAPGQRGMFEALQHEDVQKEDEATVDKARAACEEFRPQFDHEPDHEQERDEIMLVIADCLREQGIDDVPDDLGGIDHDDLGDEFAAALEACRNEVGVGQ